MWSALDGGCAVPWGCRHTLCADPPHHPDLHNSHVHSIADSPFLRPLAEWAMRLHMVSPGSLDPRSRICLTNRLRIQAALRHG